MDEKTEELFGALRAALTGIRDAMAYASNSEIPVGMRLSMMNSLLGGIQRVLENVLAEVA